MKISAHRRALLIAAGAILLPSAAIAQETVTANNVTVGNVVEGDGAEPVREERDDKDFPWGLLGLLGLAGLLGRKKHDDRDIHVDARRDNRT